MITGYRAACGMRGYPVNTELVLASSSSKPALKALLVQQPGAHLPTGGFNASATMTVDYQ